MCTSTTHQRILRPIFLSHPSSPIVQPFEIPISCGRRKRNLSRSRYLDVNLNFSRRKITQKISVQQIAIIKYPTRVCAPLAGDILALAVFECYSRDDSGALLILFAAQVYAEDERVILTRYIRAVINSRKADAFPPDCTARLNKYPRFV